MSRSWRLLSLGLGLIAGALGGGLALGTARACKALEARRQLELEKAGSQPDDLRWMLEVEEEEDGVVARVIHGRLTTPEKISQAISAAALAAQELGMLECGHDGAGLPLLAPYQDPPSFA